MGIGSYIVWEQWGKSGEHDFGLLDYWNSSYELENVIDELAEK